MEPKKAKKKEEATDKSQVTEPSQQSVITAREAVRSSLLLRVGRNLTQPTYEALVSAIGSDVHADDVAQEDVVIAFNEFFDTDEGRELIKRCLEPQGVIALLEAQLAAAKEEAAPIKAKVHKLERLKLAIYEETTVYPYTEEEVIGILLRCFNSYISLERKFRQIIRADWEIWMRTVNGIDPYLFFRAPPILVKPDLEARKMNKRHRRLYRHIQELLKSPDSDWKDIKLLIELYMNLQRRERDIQERELEREFNTPRTEDEYDLHA